MTLVHVELLKALAHSPGQYLYVEDRAKIAAACDLKTDKIVCLRKRPLGCFVKFSALGKILMSAEILAANPPRRPR